MPQTIVLAPPPERNEPAVQRGDEGGTLLTLADQGAYFDGHDDG